MKLKVLTLENKAAGDIELSDTVYGVEVRPDLLNRAVKWQRNKARQGTHKVKTISEISGTGKKPFAQKGTGRARAGSTRATHMRGGQTVFGPVVRSHETSLPKKIRQAALRCALSSKAAEKKLVVLDEAKAKSHKTKDMTKTLKSLDLTSALFIFDGDLDTNFGRAVSNIPHIDVLPQGGANVYDILKHDHLVVTKQAAKDLEARLQKAK
jgi:large subunit ribosomal protein L4